MHIGWVQIRHMVDLDHGRKKNGGSGPNFVYMCGLDDSSGPDWTWTRLWTQLKT